MPCIIVLLHSTWVGFELWLFVFADFLNHSVVRLSCGVGFAFGCGFGECVFGYMTGRCCWRIVICYEVLCFLTYVFLFGLVLFAQFGDFGCLRVFVGTPI